MEPESHLHEAKLRKSRLQAWVTRACSAAKDVISEQVDDAQLRGTRNNLLTKYDNYKQACDRYVLLIDDDSELDAALSEITAFDTDVEIVLAQLSIMIDRNLSKSSNPVVNPVVTGYNAAEACKMSVRLPKLELPLFTGDTTDWPTFWDLFQVTIHNNKHLSMVQKFAHLKSLVRGEAARCIASIPTTEANYMIAIDQLQHRYGNQELLRSKLLMKLTEMQHLECYRTLREGVDDLLVTVRALEVQGISAADYGTLLMPVVESHMPKAWRLLWARQKTSSAKFHDLLVFIESELKVHETAERDFGSHPATKTHNADTHDEICSTASALPAHVKPEHPPLQCTFCSGQHKPVECTVHMPVDERFNKVREKKACFRCAIPNHRVASCRWKKHCSCGRLHITQLCTGPKPHQLNVGAVPFVQQSTVPTPPLPSVHQAGDTIQGLRMRTVCVQFGQITARALCDTGSTYSLMSTRLSRMIPHRVVGKKKLRIQTFGNIVEEVFNIISVTATGINCSKSLTFNVLVTDAVMGSFEQVNQEAVAVFRSHFGGEAILADIPGDSADPLDLIIGEDIYDQVVLGHPVKLAGDMKATLTIFGWMLHGGQVSSTHVSTAYVFRVTVQDALTDFWKLEHLGVTPHEDNVLDIEQDVKNGMTRDESGRYSVGWPWKPQSRDHIALNKTMSERRLQRLIDRMNDSEYAAYDIQIRQLLADKYIEEIPHTEAPECYLPHRGVVKVNSSTSKLRIVFDASAKSQGKLSLNEALETGPNLLPLLWGTLLRFRIGRIAVVGDLEKAFLQIVLKESDRNACCFMWQHPDGVVVSYRLSRVFFGATSSPFLLQAVLKQHLESETVYRDTAKVLLRNLYVDDSVNSVDTDAEAQSFWNKAVDIFCRGGFNLRKFQSNSSNLTIQKEVETVHNVLGVPWHIEKDALLPMANFQCELKCVTKRAVASLLAKVYDPLGISLPVVTPLKLFLQDLWKLKTSWDSSLDDCNRQRLDEIIHDLAGFDTLAVPRWLGTVRQSDTSRIVEIHVFTDASSRAYAAVAYLRLVNSAKTTVTLLTARARLASPNGETIPRLELMAILFGSRLLQSLKSEFSQYLSVSSYYLWSDSSVALSWVRKGPSVGGVFIANRVREITSVDAVRRWVPGTCNPADLPTRGVTVLELKMNSLWWQGPSWLHLDSSCWPCWDFTDDDFCLVGTSMSPQPTKQSWLDELTDPTRTSKWKRTVRSVCWMLRWKKRGQSRDIQLHEVRFATRVIFRQVQKKVFGVELVTLESGKSCPKQSSIKSLYPFVRDGVLRMGGRLQQCSATFDEKHPVLLRRCGVVDQFILDVHDQIQHAGASFVISELRRQGVWILRPKKSVSSVIRTCRRCYRFIAAPAAEASPPYPSSRVTLDRAFTYTGMDLGGPMYLKDGSKTWFVLFTCMTVRAIHLELVSSLSEEALRLAVQRFISRRGTPVKLISDHGTNFVALSRWIAGRGIPIEYEFTVERGPWWGGAWERLIRAVKCLLRRGIGKSLLNWEQLETVLVEAEKVINRRPITFQWEGAHPDGIPLPVFPEQFLLPPAADVSLKQRDFDVTEQLQLRETYFQELSAIWHTEYLLQVLGSKGEIWKSQPSPLHLGEVVLVGDEDKRLHWKLGVVTELHVGRDNRCRAATVRVNSGVLRRPIQKLYKLELMSDSIANPPTVDGAAVTSSDFDETIDSQEPTVCVDDKDINAGDNCSDDDTHATVTRCGRTVTLPARFRH